jgi:hypothetical protein
MQSIVSVYHFTIAEIIPNVLSSIRRECVLIVCDKLYVVLPRKGARYVTWRNSVPFVSYKL